MYKYRGFAYQLKPLFEFTESRLIRGDYKSQTIGYRIILWNPHGDRFRRRKGGMLKIQGSKDQADQYAMCCIDAIIDSL